MFNLREATREELSIILMPLKLTTLFFKLYVQLGLDVSDKQIKLVPNQRVVTGGKEQSLHVHLVRSRFGLFLWEAAQHDSSDGPLKDTRRIGHGDS